MLVYYLLLKFVDYWSGRLLRPGILSPLLKFCPLAPTGLFCFCKSPLAAFSAKLKADEFGGQVP